MTKGRPVRRRNGTRTLASRRAIDRRPAPRPWWGEGRAPQAIWPGVTIDIPAVWSKKRERWESPDGRYYFDMAAADRACEFFPTFLTHHIGEFAGQPFTLMEYQAKLLVRPMFGWKRASDGFRRFRKVFAFLPKGAGKALAVDTPIATPEGWIQMGKLQVGDQVFNDTGRPCTVTRVSETWTDRACYELTFSDGAKITASAEHLWQTTAQRNGQPRGRRAPGPRLGDPSLVTTQQIAATLIPPPSTSRHPQAKWNHRIEVAPALELATKALPIPPYTLGVWLGDGDSDSPRITCADVDLQIVQEIGAEGVKVREQRRHVPGAKRYSIGAGPHGGDWRTRGGLHKQLASLRLLNNKHIPPTYLRASLAQRLALLQGLMDADGTVDREGRAEFSVMCMQLAHDVLELITSLGYKVRERITPATLYGRHVGVRYRLHFRPTPATPVFRLLRKKTRVRPKPATRMLASSRRIVGCHLVPSVPVRCIMIDDPRGMFLAGSQLVPTHNSPLGSGVLIYCAICDQEPAAENYCVAADREQARIVYTNAKVMVEASDELSEGCEILRDSLYWADTKSVVKVLSSDATTKHGFRPHVVAFDELHAQRNRDLYEALRKSMVKRRQPLMLILTHAGDDDETIGYEEYEYAKKVLSGTNPDETCLPVIFEAQPDDDWTDPEVWRRVNPGHGITVKHDGIVNECNEAQNEPRKLNDFLKFHLNRWVNQATAWIPVDWWDRCDAPLPSDEVLRQCPCAIGVDMAQKIDLASAVAAFKLPLEDPKDANPIEVVGETETGEVVKRTLSLDYRIALIPAFWLPEETLRERVRQDRVPYDEWERKGALFKVDGAIIGAEALVSYIAGRPGRPGLLERFPRLKAGQVAYDPAFATEVALALRDRHGLTVVEVLQNYKHLSEPCQVFEALVKARRIIHGGHALLRWNLENVGVKHDDAGRIRMVKPGKATKRIDGVVAAVMAISRLMLLPPSRPRRRGPAMIWTPAGFVPAHPAETGHDARV